MNIREKFWAKVDVRGAGECWPWLASKRNGYGQFYLQRGYPRVAHRVSYALSVGPIPVGLYVCHKCDVRDCVNPDHLFLGTARDNTQDMIEKGREYKGPKAGDASVPRGERHWMRRRPEKLAAFLSKQRTVNGRYVKLDTDIQKVVGSR